MVKKVIIMGYRHEDQELTDIFPRLLPVLKTSGISIGLEYPQDTDIEGKIRSYQNALVALSGEESGQTRNFRVNLSLSQNVISQKIKYFCFDDTKEKVKAAGDAILRGDPSLSHAREEVMLQNICKEETHTVFVITGVAHVEGLTTSLKANGIKVEVCGFEAIPGREPTPEEVKEICETVLQKVIPLPPQTHSGPSSKNSSQIAEPLSKQWIFKGADTGIFDIKSEIKSTLEKKNLPGDWKFHPTNPSISLKCTEELATKFNTYLQGNGIDSKINGGNKITVSFIDLESFLKQINQLNPFVDADISISTTPQLTIGSKS